MEVMLFIISLNEFSWLWWINFWNTLNCNEVQCINTIGIDLEITAIELFNVNARFSLFTSNSKQIVHYMLRYCSIWTQFKHMKWKLGMVDAYRVFIIWSILWVKLISMLYTHTPTNKYNSNNSIICLSNRIYEIFMHFTILLLLFFFFSFSISHKFPSVSMIPITGP